MAPPARLETPGARSTALVVGLVGASLATVLLFSPFLAEYDATRGSGPAHLVDAWRLTTRSPLDGGQRVATLPAVLVVLTTLVTLVGVWAGSHLGQVAPLVVAAVSSALAIVAGFVVAGTGEFGDGYSWTSAWGLTAWQAAHALVLVAMLMYAAILGRSRPAR